MPDDARTRRPQEKRIETKTADPLERIKSSGAKHGDTAAAIRRDTVTATMQRKEGGA